MPRKSLHGFAVLIRVSSSACISWHILEQKRALRLTLQERASGRSEPGVFLRRGHAVHGHRWQLHSVVSGPEAHVLCIEGGVCLAQGIVSPFLLRERLFEVFDALVFPLAVRTL